MAWEVAQLAFISTKYHTRLKQTRATPLPRTFHGPHRYDRHLYGVSDADDSARSSVRHLRAVAARYPDASEVSGLVKELLAGSEEFASIRADHDVSARHVLAEIFEHHQALRVLSVVGVQAQGFPADPEKQARPGVIHPTRQVVPDEPSTPR
ncbi:MmyB family transcriptional regulator [Streptomyces rubrogriseus]|uniref:MmyB family transcriptional regulator n=1 Tax=Streptomyces rubrogriseus TaxID=194673 RepID=UPI003814C87C